MSLNSNFKHDPKSVLDKYWDINSSQNAIGTRYKVNSMGIGFFDLKKYSDETLSLEDGTGKSGAIKAYYLESKYGETNKLILQDTADYFFTDTITGCQFAAYGNDKNRMMVSHANALDRDTAALQKAAYQADANQVNAKGTDHTVVYGQDDYRKTGLKADENPGNVVVTVIGWRKSDGWHFYARRRINDENSRRVLDAAAFEL